MAATFVDISSGKAIRIVAREDARELAARLYPHLETKKLQQMQAYRDRPAEELFTEQWVRVTIDPADIPGTKSERVMCEVCGEGVNFGRYLEIAGRRLCLSCAHPELRYWRPD